jgi:hypothetical protein
MQRRTGFLRHPLFKFDKIVFERFDLVFDILQGFLMLGNRLLFNIRSPAKFGSKPILSRLFMSEILVKGNKPATSCKHFCEIRRVPYSSW